MGEDLKKREPQVVDCCVVGGGPAGMMAGFLLARAGVRVAVLEKHGDFLRDFRGDTIHPSTLELMWELGLLEEFLKRPHQEIEEVRFEIAGEEFRFADFRHVPTHCKFVALMPQWDFLSFVAEHAKRLPTFSLHMNTKGVGLIEEGGAVRGVRGLNEQGELEFRAKLVIGADGRHSTMREAANLKVEDLGAPIDVLWMRVSRVPSDPGDLNGIIDKGRMLVMIDRGEYWQCAFVIPKGGYGEVRERGLEAFRADVLKLAPFLGKRVEELKDWEQIKLLTVAVDRLIQWHRPGLLCIGDAAHAMSPVGGVGINLAIQDAVAAANLLMKPLKEGAVTDGELAAVQERREKAAVRTQRVQVFVHRRFLSRVVEGKEVRMPWYMRALLKVPLVRRVPARVVGVGFQPEHVRK
ncbi:MAG: FAD-dependent oxidoreductase [Phycisphaerae bacterium]